MGIYDYSIDYFYDGIRNYTLLQNSDISFNNSFWKKKKSA